MKIHCSSLGKMLLKLCCIALSGLLYLETPLEWCLVQLLGLRYSAWMTTANVVEHIKGPNHFLLSRLW